MNWQDKIYESLTEAKLVGTSRGPKKGQISRTYSRGKKGSRKRTTVSVKGGKLRRKDWTAPKSGSGWKGIVDKPHPHFDDAELGQMGDTTARERSGTHGRRGRRG